MRLLRLAPLVFALAAFAQDKPSAATPAEELTVAPGFKVELLKSATKKEGSWVSMAVDAKGRLYISTQGKVEGAGWKKDDKWGGLFRATLDASGKIAQWEKINVPVGDSMGMLWAFDSLYVSGEGPEGRGIYRLKDSNGDDALDSWAMWKKVPGGNGEHGAHALVLGPGGKSIYIVHGNSTPLIEGVDPKSPYRNYAEDDLLPRVMDPVATFFDKIKSPYGYVLRTDENGSKWDLFAGGFRNPYDIDFNADGELFTYDSDMEWDVGSPWYRPTRVLHVVAGGEYGFREGTAKWPAYYPDSLPAAVDIGLGCPTGVKFGTNSNFPDKYRRAFFIQDWTFGRIIAVHLRPQGASYTAKNDVAKYQLVGPNKSEDVEEFVRGKGLPVTDLEFGKDGAMYFTIGGRGTQAGLYRVSWAGEKVKPSDDYVMDGNSNARALMNGRQQNAETLVKNEHGFARTFHNVTNPDRFYRFAVRTALESLPVNQWRDQAVNESDPAAALSMLLALARVGTKDDLEPILKALGKFPLDSLSDELKLDKLRVIEVALARHGRPSTDTVQMAIEKLSRQYPAKTFALNRELCALLVWLTRSGDIPVAVPRDSAAPGGAAAPLRATGMSPLLDEAARSVIDKTLALMDASTEPAEQVWYALCLREASGWTPLQREHYFSWFAKAKTYRGGNNFSKFILRIRDQALEKVPADQRQAMLALAEKEIAKPQPAAPMPARPFVKAWTLDDLVPSLGEVAKGRDFARGERLYRETLCSQCHLFAGKGGDAKAGAIGPDLTAVGSRFSRKDVLEAILDPSKAISEQYASFLLTFDDGFTAAGQIAEENHYLLTLVVDPLTGAKQNFPKTRLRKKEMSPASLMPPGLIYSLSKEEVLDLLAYLESAGNPDAQNFQK